MGSTTVVPDPLDPQVLTITVTNAYPSYSADCEVEFLNTGTIPWKVRGTTIIAVSPNLTPSGPPRCTLVDLGDGSKRLDCDQLTVKYVDGFEDQRETGQEVASSLRFHVEQAASESATYVFQVVVCVAQWNEPATFGECVAAAPP